jgi:hypothetical protein
MLLCYLLMHSIQALCYLRMRLSYLPMHLLEQVRGMQGQVRESLCISLTLRRVSYLTLSLLP